MEKVYGSPKRQDGLYKVGRNKYEIIYGFGKDNEEDEIGWNYRQRFKNRPTLDEIKAVINAQLSADADERKRNGFQWKGVPVRYDEEAERNITGLSVKIPRLGAAMFPLKFKLGDYPDGSPAFHEFADAEEFESFTDALMMFSQECYNKSWQEKAAIDWTKFENAL